MSYAEKRNGNLTGYWLVEVTIEGKRRRRAFKIKADADRYERHVKDYGVEPANVVDGKLTPAKGRSFGEVCKLAMADGGPNGKWHQGRDRSLPQRLTLVMARIGSYALEDVSWALVRDRVHNYLLARRHYSQNTLNHYTTAVQAVLRWAEYEGLIAQVPRMRRPKARDQKKRHPWSWETEDAIVSWLAANQYPAMATVVRFLAHTGI